MATEIRCGGLLFTSKFDSGNLAAVEKPERSDSDSDGVSNNLYGCTIAPDYEFNIWTKPDCAGTNYENGNRSWFYFGIRGNSPNKLIKLNIVNLNRQGKLYSQGMVPLVKVIPTRPKWERIRDRATYQTIDGQFTLSFTYRFTEQRGGTTYFAFCYPWSYTESQEALERYDEKHQGCVDIRPGHVADSTIYYHRELACYSIDKRRIDLITITSCRGMCNEREPRLDNLFPDKHTARAHRFSGKKVYYISSRVHPGETPASFVFNGFLEFALRENDPRAQRLRDRFVIKLVPMLNPDGVFRGHYRTDQRGVNLNRLYLLPEPRDHPSIFMSRSLLLFYHHYYRVRKEDDLSPREAGDGAGTQAEESTSLEEKSYASESPASQNDKDCKPDAGDAEDSGNSLKINGIHATIAKAFSCKSKKEQIKEAKYVPFQGNYLSIPPRESGIGFYVDLHGHASKRGCFIYGNHLEAEEDQIDNLLFPRLIALNSAHFDFNGCNFTERNMYLKDKRDGMSKEGSGRVAIFKTIGIIHSYTLECNYNTGRTVNCIPAAIHDSGRATPPPQAGFPPKYTPEIFEEVGRAMAIAALDFFGCNPWSRLKHSEFTTMENLRIWMTRYVRSSRGNPILPRKMARISTRIAPNGNGLGQSNSSSGSSNNSNGRNRLSNNLENRSNQQFQNSSSKTSNLVNGIVNKKNMSNGGTRLIPVKSIGSTITNQQQKNDLSRRQKTLIRVSVNHSNCSLKSHPDPVLRQKLVAGTGNTNSLTENSDGSPVTLSFTNVHKNVSQHEQEKGFEGTSKLHSTSFQAKENLFHEIEEKLVSNIRRTPDRAENPTRYQLSGRAVASPIPANMNFAMNNTHNGTFMNMIHSAVSHPMDHRNVPANMNNNIMLQNLYSHEFVDEAGYYVTDTETINLINRRQASFVMKKSNRTTVLGPTALFLPFQQSRNIPKPMSYVAKPPGSGFISPQISKPPSLLYRGRSPGPSRISNRISNQGTSVSGGSNAMIMLPTASLASESTIHNSQTGKVSNAINTTISPLIVAQKPIIAASYDDNNNNLGSFADMIHLPSGRRGLSNRSGDATAEHARPSSYKRAGKLKIYRKKNSWSSQSENGSDSGSRRGSFSQKGCKPKPSSNRSLGQLQQNTRESLLSGEAVRLSPRVQKSVVQMNGFLEEDADKTEAAATSHSENEHLDENVVTDAPVAPKMPSPTALNASLMMMNSHSPLGNSDGDSDIKALVEFSKNNVDPEFADH